MNPWSIDPLDGLEQRPLEVQVAVMATELRNQRNMLGDALKEVGSLRKAIIGAAITFAGGSLIFAATIWVTFHP